MSSTQNPDVQNNGLFKKVVRLLSEHPFVLLGPLWLIVQLYLWMRFGVQHHYDTHRYLAYADHFRATGELGYSHEFWYLSYALWLSLFRSITENEVLVILGQILLSGLATCMLYFISLQLSKSKICAFFSSLLFVIWIKGQWWNYFLLTESLYISCNIVLLGLLLKLAAKEQAILMRPKAIILLLPLLVFTFFVRPVGILTLICVVAFIFVDLLSKSRSLGNYKWPGLTLLGISIPLGILLFTKAIENYDLLRAFTRGEVICAIFECELINNLDVPASEGHKLLEIVSFVLRNPLFFLEISIRRMWAFWSGYREGFSVGHNALTLAFLCPVYVLALLGVFRTFLASAKAFMILFVLLNAAMILVTCVNYDGRFIAPVLPIIFIFAGIGLSSIISGNNLAK